MGNLTGARLTALDGLRGWAALSVLVSHFAWETFGAIFPEMRGYFVAVLGNDILAISIFFVLSGYVLTRFRWDRQSAPLAPTLGARYLRLTLPIAAATLVTLLIVVLGWNANLPAASIVGRPDWLGAFLPFQPSLTDAAWFAAIGAFVTQDKGSYNPFLWTMIVELWGSLIVLTLSQFRAQAWQAVVLVVLSLLLLRFYSIGSGMMLGALLALHDARRPATARAVAFTPVIVAAILLLGGCLKLAEAPQAITMACAVVLVAVAREANAVSRFLESPLSRWLGHLSFPMYLAQFAILVTVTSHLIVQAQASGALNVWAALGIALASIGATLAASYVLVPVETATKHLTRLLKSRRVVPAAQLS